MRELNTPVVEKYRVKRWGDFDPNCRWCEGAGLAPAHKFRGQRRVRIDRLEVWAFDRKRPSWNLCVCPCKDRRS